MSQEITHPIRILITGVAGFIGSHMAENLVARDCHVTGIDNFDAFYPKSIKEKNLKYLKNKVNFRFLEADIRDLMSLKQAGSEFDIVIHMAAKAGVLPSIEAPSEYIKTNIEGTHCLLEWMRKNRLNKLLFASSSSVYGDSDVIPFSENLPTNNPISPYAFTKKSCELLNYTYHHLYDINVLNLRLFTVYGERQRPDLAIHKFIKKIDRGETISIYGDGTSARDYTYIADIVDGFNKALNYILRTDNCYEIINLGNNNPVTLNDLVNDIAEILNTKLNVKYESMKPGDVMTTFADITKAKSLLGYKPSTNMKTGLRNFIDWYKNQN